MTTDHVLAKDISAFERRKAELMEHYGGKFVVFHNGEFKGSFDSFDSAARDALKRFRDTPFLIRQVGARESGAGGEKSQDVFLAHVQIPQLEIVEYGGRR